MNYKFENDQLICDDKLGEISLYDLEGSFDEAIQKLNNIKDQYQTNKQYFPRDYHFNSKYKGAHFYYSFYINKEYEDQLTIRGKRIVAGTELIEYNQKITQKNQEKKEREQQLYEELKKKFEKH